MRPIATALLIFLTITPLIVSSFTAVIAGESGGAGTGVADSPSMIVAVQTSTMCHIGGTGPCA